MVKWDDKHMYNWIGWMRSLLAMRERINQWTVSPKKAYKFPVFMANNVILSSVLFFIVGPMTMLQTFEWIMSLLMRWVNKEMERGALDSIKGLPVVMATLFILIPYTVTWGIPKLIGEIKQRRVERRLEKQVEDMETLREQIAEDRRRWEHREGIGRAVEELERQRRELQEAIDRRRKEDFRPKKIIKHHQFGDTPKIRIFTRDEQPIRRTPSRRDRTIRRVRILE